MQGGAQVRLVFAGEILPGHQADEVKRRFGEKFKLEGARLAAMFSGERTVLKRSLSYDDAISYMAQLQKYGVRVHMEPLDAPPAPAPVATAVRAVVPPQAAVAPAPLAIAEEQITCPNCGETQSMRVLCRSCATDMPRGIAARKEDEDRARAERLEAARARRGLPPSGSAHAPQHDEDAPPLMGFGLSGRVSRLTYINSILVSWIALLWLGMMALTRPGVFTVLLFLVGLVVISLWSLRVTVLRLHDFNASGWWSSMFLVPYIGQAVSVALLFIPGSRDDNDHGGLPRPGSKLVAGVLVLVFVLSVAASWRPAVRAFTQMLQEDEETETFDGVSASGPAPSDRELSAHIESVTAIAGFRDEYWNQANHKAFAASDDGAWGHGAGQTSPRQAVTIALQRCEERRKPYTRSCHLLNVNGSWVVQR
ncbi:MAG TPA: DUF805 domain-containing protein [Rhizobacter sp.]|nr:DUF805 domain-containing protein [Rhizobacter sp.]